MTPVPPAGEAEEPASSHDKYDSMSFFSPNLAHSTFYLVCFSHADDHYVSLQSTSPLMCER